MSHDASPSRTARNHDAARDDDDDDDDTILADQTLPNHNANSPARSRSASRQRRKKKSKKKRNPGLAKKLGFITHLLKTLDLVVFAELSALYYMEYVHLRLHDSLALGIPSDLSTPDAPCFDSCCARPASTCT